MGNNTVQGIRNVKIKNLTLNGRRPTDAFTLIEMIGVLSIIAILAGLVLPKVANAISDAKIESSASSYESVQTAVVGHLGKYLAYNALFGTNFLSVPIVNYDTTFLIPEGLLDHAFVPKIGGPNAVLQLVNATACDNSQGYFFAGVSNGIASTASMQYVMECVLTNVSFADAYGISLTVDGPALTPGLDGLVDTAGKVVSNPTLNGGTVRMFVDGH
jgi:prepilin-type N-terminal cleavage/methylation domain-containing protein